jgi:hypothetical protein
MHSLDPVHAVTTVAEAAYCPRCELRHTRRPDWMCPRCGAPVDTETPSTPKTVRAPAPRPGFPLGSRIAGAVMALGGAATAYGFLAQLAEHRWRLLASAVVLAALGVALLLKVRAARWAAAAVAVVAAAVVAEALLRQRFPDLVRDPLPALVRERLRELLRDVPLAGALSLVGFDVGALLLVAGRPRAWRVAAGVLLAAPLLVLELLRALGR